MLFEIEEHLGKRFGVIEKSLGMWGDKNCRERSGRNEEKKRTNPLYRNPSFLMDQEVSRIKKARNSYREVSIAKGPRWIEKLLSIYRAYRNFLDGLSSCWEAIQIESQESRWIEFAITAIEKRSSKGLIDSLAVERYREVVEIA